MGLIKLVSNVEPSSASDIMVASPSLMELSLHLGISVLMVDVLGQGEDGLGGGVLQYSHFTVCSISSSWSYLNTGLGATLLLSGSGVLLLGVRSSSFFLRRILLESSVFLSKSFMESTFAESTFPSFPLP